MINVVLPKYFNLVVGDTFQLFYRGVIEAPNPYVYDILALCEKGKNCPRYFEFTPDCEGDYELTINVYSAEKSLLGSATTTLRARIAHEPKRPINILCMGSSGTQNGDWPHEAYRRLTATDGEPKGLGLKNINFVGSKRRGDMGYEGYGGWVFKTYVTKNPTGVWITCNHDKDPSDQHTIWRDEDGRLWKLETITKKKLKFLRLDKTDTTYPAPGTYLTNVENAVHKEPIKIEKCADEAKTPFYNPEKEALDFEWYKEKCAICGDIDYVFVKLGANEVADSSLPIDFSSDASIKALCQRTVENAKEFIGVMKEAFPRVKIKMLGLKLPSMNGGIGANYGAKLPYCDRYGYVKFVLELNRSYEALSYDPEYSDFVEFINVSAQFDSEYAFPTVEKPVNTRCKQTETIGTNGLHPTHEGYLMVGDAAFRSMINLD